MQSTSSQLLLTAYQSLPPLLPSLPFPKGALTLLLGDPGIGKSLLAIDLAARLTNNSPPPPHPHITRPTVPDEQIPESHNPDDYAPASAIVLSMEDTHATLVQRLITAGADRNFLALSAQSHSLVPDEKLPAKNPGGPKRLAPAPLLQWLTPEIKRLRNPRLLILDPLPAFLGTSDCTCAALIRTLLRPLIVLAEHYGFAILGISHLNKSTHVKNPLHRALGSQAYIALARSIYLLTPDNSPPLTTGHCPLTTRSRRLLIPLKSNLSPLTHALAFTITPQATLAWHPEPIPLADSPFPTLSQSPSPPPDPFLKSQLDFACEFLQTSLQPGPLPSNLLLQQARSLGISSRTLHRARFQLHIHCHKDPHSAHWLAYLPKDNPP